MSSDEGLNEYIDWLKRSISDGHIQYYKYSDFKNIKKIGFGAFGSVSRANWKDSIFALKSFINKKSTLKEVVNELKLHLNVHNHKNIITLYGITKIETDVTLVLEYADSDTLETYLSKHFSELDWNDKYQLALQLASAVEYIHERDIIHRDLHAKNILVHQNVIKLADFGLSKKIAEASNTFEIFGVIPYIDSKKYTSENYKLNKKSDVYSIGVIMWQISSGYRPFYAEGVKYDISLVLAIRDGGREKIIKGTPIGYSNLYKECWKHEPHERPTIQEVVSTLSISRYEPNGSIVEEDHSSDEENHPSDLHDDLEIPSIENRSISKNNLSSQAESSINTFKSTLKHINNIVVDKLIKIIVKKHDQGITFDQIQQLINQQILKSDQNTDRLIKWIIKNQFMPQYSWFLGLLYYYHIGIKENSTKAFELFSRAADKNYSIAQVYLAKCYNDGYGTKRNGYLAFEWYRKSAESESIIGQFYLGYCYEYSIGIEKDEKKAVHWYKKAANKENITAKLYLANCYRLGKGVKKDENEALKYYKVLSEQEIADAQQQLGNCFYDGIGTKVDKIQAKCWYEKAAKNGNIIAKDILKKNYNKNIRKDKLYKILFTKKLSQIGSYYVGKVLIKTSYERAFYYFQKEAENGNKVAQYNLGNCYRIGEGVKKDGRKAFELFKKSAEQGYMNGKFRLGDCYSKGIGTDINKAKAIELFKIAAKKENSGAQNNLGVLYKNGDGVEKDLEKAIYWFNKAAKNGNEVAQYNLGHCYKLGIGVKGDKVKAFEFYKKSAEQGYSDGKFQLGNCYNEGIGTKINKEKAFILIKDVAKKGNKIAQNSLGILYENGEGTNKNLQMTFYWFKKAADNGNEVAQYNLGLCYENGKGIEKDEVRAFYLYNKSAEKGYLIAQDRVIFCYDKGIGTVIDKEKALELRKKIEKKEDFTQKLKEKLEIMAFY